MTIPTLGRVSPDEFRTCLRGHAAGVVVVTALGPDGPAGLTVTSFTAASLTPPLVSFYADRRSRTWPVIRGAGHFGVNLLAAGQPALAQTFARPGADRFAATAWSPGAAGVPWLSGALAHLSCAVDQVVEVGDHFLVVGLVLHTAPGAGAPLVYHEARYTTVA
ncbi:flavin reductase family protein [Paractinoplanes ovalisporus]|uniref:flavin reductase family protein n=1 Tax=Paractinoplanes ovalisporus TaxID=2810368 RepID=UPI0027DC1DA9|nr:flavin reductase family protein [Actinoplanes ovalisporus]